MKPLDDTALPIILENRNMLVPWYLMASYLYYIKDISLLTDHLFDTICKRLDEEWDEVEHFHKHLVDRSQLTCGTGFYLLDDQYPERVKGAAWSLVNEQSKYVGKSAKARKPQQSFDVVENAKALAKPAPVKTKQGGFF